MEFSKKLLLMDYGLTVVLFILTVIFKDVELVAVDVAWIAQIGISTGAYYWKAKNENRTKVPLKVIESLPPRIRKEIDLTAVITAIIQSD